MREIVAVQEVDKENLWGAIYLQQSEFGVVVILKTECIAYIFNVSRVAIEGIHICTSYSKNLRISFISGQYCFKEAICFSFLA